MTHIHFEAKKHSLRQSQDGSVTISLNIHPNDVDARLLTAPMGKVFQVVLVDPDEIQATHEAEPQARDTLTQQAAIICQGARWMEYVDAKYPGHQFKDGADAIRKICGVKSRTEIKVGTPAGERFTDLKADFEAYMKHGVL